MKRRLDPGTEVLITMVMIPVCGLLIWCVFNILPDVLSGWTINDWFICFLVGTALMWHFRESKFLHMILSVLGILILSPLLFIYLLGQRDKGKWHD